MFDELDLQFAIITESWLKDGSTLDRDIIDLEHGTQLKIIYKNRPVRAARARQVGGGVSIIYNKNLCSLRERRIASRKFELVVATGKINGLNRSVAIFAVYIQPRMKVDELEALRELIADTIIQMKANPHGDDPIFFIGGDLNHRDLGPAFDNLIDITRVNYDPTRGPACLDVIYSNVSSPRSQVFPPLQGPRGAPSDHACVWVGGTEIQERDYSWTKKTVRVHSQAACDNFAHRISGTNWGDVLGPDPDPDVMVKRYEEYTAKLTDELFPLKQIRIRDNEAPWITNGIRALSRRKKRAYKRGGGKTPHWHRLQEKLTELIDRSRTTFVDSIASMGSTTGAYFKAVKSLSCKARPAQWKVESLFPGKTSSEAGEAIAGYFTQISDGFTPITDVAPSPEAIRPPVTRDYVAKKLKEAKKPSSMVNGDLLPRLMKRYHHLLVEPITTIFNAIFACGRWPSSWKQETAVIIPKVAAPPSLADCRNISCTNFLSKVLESILLDDLRREIPIDKCQYGGIKGCSVDHLLVDAWDAILRALDGGGHAVMLGIDYQKAFNRLDHRECLRQLQKLGASPSSLALVRSFLAGRCVRVRLSDGTLSSPRILNGGSPQGSILGCLLYCLTTQQINKDLLPDRLPPPQLPPPPTNTSPASPESTLGSHASESPEGFRLLSPDSSTSPITPEVPDGGDAMGEMPDRVEEGATGLVFFKYVDDTTTIETVPGERAIKHYSSTTPREEIFPHLTAAMLEAILRRTEEIGMIVNCKKTQMICISLDNGCITSARIACDTGDNIECTNNMKLLGYMFDETPTANAQFDYIRKKFRGRFWSIIHLKRSGISGMQLFKLYTVFVRPLIESNCVIYDSMLTKYQSDQIELMQKRVLRLCFGSNTHYNDSCSTFAISKLKARRTEAVRKFVAKNMVNQRFSEKWFKPRPADENNLRNRRPYIEDKARTRRFQKSPLLTMQRIANDIATRA